MKKATGGLTILIFLLCAFSAQAQVISCDNDSDCTSADLCTVGSCSSPASECVFEPKDCSGDVCDPSDGACVECVDTTDCTVGVCDPSSRTCVVGFCDESNPCTVGVCDLSTNTCVECLGDTDCTDPAAPVCDTNTNTCVECVVDDDCPSGEICSINDCVECVVDNDCPPGEVCTADICVPSAGDPCSSDLDCGPGEICVDDVCSAAQSCSSDLDCDPDEVCVDDICVPSAGDPCSSDLDCGPGEICVDDVCLEGECATSADCGEGEFCADNNTCVQSDDCELRIRKGRININKKRNLPFVRQKLKIKGNENFDPYGEISVDDPLLVWPNTIRQKPKKLKFIIEVTTDPMPDEGFYPIRVGNCIGEVELYDKKAGK